jgi:membrane-anchored protein YejM (alkaline phosphatase superfamily)
MGHPAGLDRSPGLSAQITGAGMETAFSYLTVLAVLAVFLVLLAGLWNMMRGSNPNRSQKLMRWRVGLQFVAIVIAMILVYFWRT